MVQQYGADGPFHKGVFGMTQQRLCRMSPSGMQGGEAAVLWRKYPCLLHTSCQLSAKGKSSIAYQVVLFLY